MHYELDDFDWSTIIICSIPARAAASQSLAACRMSCITHCCDSRRALL